MPKINRKTQIRKILERAGIYDDKLSSQIALTVRLETLLNRLHERIVNVDPLDVEISASGTEKQVVNPLIPYIMKLEAQLQDSYTALGLNYHATPSKIRESTKPEDSEKSSLDNFLEKIAK